MKKSIIQVSLPCLLILSGCGDDPNPVTTIPEDPPVEECIDDRGNYAVCPPIEAEEPAYLED